MHNPYLMKLFELHNMQYMIYGGTDADADADADARNNSRDTNNHTGGSENSDSDDASNPQSKLTHVNIDKFLKQIAKGVKLSSVPIYKGLAGKIKDPKNGIEITTSGGGILLFTLEHDTSIEFTPYDIPIDKNAKHNTKQIIIGICDKIFTELKIPTNE